MERFIQECKKLIETYSEDCIVRKNGTILLSPGKIPNCKHMFHKGLEQEVIDEFLVSEYKNHFPEEYIEFLKFSNGATLYRVKIKTKKFEFGMERLILFGLPLTPPFSRPMDEEEPFDIRIEDLGRHKLISKKWLKFGCYTKEEDNLENLYDIFVDTDTGKVYSCKRNSAKVEKAWSGLDNCLCELLEMIAASKKVVYNIP